MTFLLNSAVRTESISRALLVVEVQSLDLFEPLNSDLLRGHVGGTI